MEDDLKISKLEFLSNHHLNQTQILNFSLDDQIIFFKSLKLIRPPMEDDLNLLKVEYLNNHLNEDLYWKKISKY